MLQKLKSKWTYAENIISIIITKKSWQTTFLYKASTFQYLTKSQESLWHRSELFNYKYKNLKFRALSCNDSGDISNFHTDHGKLADENLKYQIKILNIYCNKVEQSKEVPQEKVYCLSASKSSRQSHSTSQ